VYSAVVAAWWNGLLARLDRMQQVHGLPHGVEVEHRISFTLDCVMIRMPLLALLPSWAPGVGASTGVVTCWHFGSSQQAKASYVSTVVGMILQRSLRTFGSRIVAPCPRIAYLVVWSPLNATIA
jgi:hypothetical protein